LLLKDIDGFDRLGGYGVVKDLMMDRDQIGPCSTREFIQSGFKEGSQLWRGMDRHGVESVGAETPTIPAQILYTSLGSATRHVTKLEW